MREGQRLLPVDVYSDSGPVGKTKPKAGIGCGQTGGQRRQGKRGRENRVGMNQKALQVTESVGRQIAELLTSQQRGEVAFADQNQVKLGLRCEYRLPTLPVPALRNGIRGEQDDGALSGKSAAHGIDQIAGRANHGFLIGADQIQVEFQVFAHPVRHGCVRRRVTKNGGGRRHGLYRRLALITIGVARKPKRFRS